MPEKKEIKNVVKNRKNTLIFLILYKIKKNVEIFIKNSINFLILYKIIKLFIKSACNILTNNVK